MAKQIDSPDLNSLDPITNSEDGENTNRYGDNLPSGQVTKPTSAPKNPFDPANLRLSQDFAGDMSVKRVHTVIPCRKPHRQEWVRVHEGEDYRLETFVYEDKTNKEFYLVDPSILPNVVGEVSRVCLFFAITRQGNPFLWQVKLPGEDGRTNSWNDSALEAARLAMAQWVRIAANMSGGYYDTSVTQSPLSDPTWPDLSMAELLEKCFRDRFLKSVDHPVLKQLRGEL